jgi:sulfopyruvate decarboxylase subunit alpha
MTWADTIAQALKDSEVSLIAYVPDISIHQVTKLMEGDPYFHVVSATREEEAIGIASGAYAVGRNAAMFMQSSGFGNCVNALASLCIPARIPLPMFINLRGEVGEFNIAQVAMGRATRPILETLGLPYYTLDTDDRLHQRVSGALKLCYSSASRRKACR